MPPEKAREISGVIKYFGTCGKVMHINYINAYLNYGGFLCPGHNPPDLLFRPIANFTLHVPAAHLPLERT